jgi:uncharacterized membrane protein (UPF0127 family)
MNTLISYAKSRRDLSSIMYTYWRTSTLLLAVMVFSLLVVAACGGSVSGTAEIATNLTTKEESILGVFSDATIHTESVSPTPKIQSLESLVKFGEESFAVELALTADQRAMGLSGRTMLVAGAGMLFVYRVDGRYPFWMKDMLFPLDLVWIGSGCNVVDITHDVPPPDSDHDSTHLPFYLPVEAVRYVLEINAGAAESHGIQIGSPVVYGGNISGRYGC